MKVSDQTLDGAKALPKNKQKQQQCSKKAVVL